MSVDWFAKLKEFDSLGKMKKTYELAIKDQEERLQKLESRRQEKELEIQAFKVEHSKLQQSYFETEKELNLCEEQASRLRDIGADQEKISKLRLEAERLENVMFEMLDRTEEIQRSLEEKKIFLTGFSATFLEIKAEVESEIFLNQKNIDQAELRIKLIEDELPVDFKNILDRTLRKKLAVGSFTRIESGSCFFCRYKISRTEESEIDMQKMLKTCPQCSRIFLPYGS